MGRRKKTKIKSYLEMIADSKIDLDEFRKKSEGWTRIMDHGAIYELLRKLNIEFKQEDSVFGFVYKNLYISLVRGTVYEENIARKYIYDWYIIDDEFKLKKKHRSERDFLASVLPHRQGKKDFYTEKQVKEYVISKF